MSEKFAKYFIIGTFTSLYFLVSIISTIHVIDFFELSNNRWMSIALAIGFELGAAASLASLIALEKMNRWIVWMLFFMITAMQIQGNMYYAFVRLADFQGWVELYNLLDWDVLAQKRLLAGISGAILPIIALGFIKALVDYLKPSAESPIETVVNSVNPSSTSNLIKEELDKIEDHIEDAIEDTIDNNSVVKTGYVDEPKEEIKSTPVKDFEKSADIIDDVDGIEIDVINPQNKENEIETVQVKSNNVNRPKPNLNLLEKLNSGLIQPQAERRIIK